MRSNYLIFRNAFWVSHLEYSPIKIKKDLKVFVTKKQDIDKRTSEYKNLIKNKPKFYIGIQGDVQVI